MKKKILSLIIILTMLVVTFLSAIGFTKIKETSGIETMYNANAYYTTQDEIKIFLKGTDENIKTTTLNANSVTVKVNGTEVTPTTKQVTSSTSSNPNSEVVMLLTLSGFTTEGQISLDIAGETLEDNDGNKSLAKSITTTSYVRFSTYGLEGSGADIILTRANYAQYLGKKISNYKTVGGTESITPPTKGSAITVSTTYRLYYIDWDNKYKDGEGTVYLKADIGSTNESPSTSFEYNETTSKIKQYNPSLYESGVTTPTTTNNNMKAVTWLLDINEWSDLKTSGNSTTIGSYVKHVVGAPPLEMMMDSYNAHYGLTNATPDTSNSFSSTNRTRLFYQYTSGKSGYKVGPQGTNQYSTFTSNYSVASDIEIDSMYYPGSSQYYWLASPSAYTADDVVNVNYYTGGRVGSGYGCNYSTAFCPLVALNSTVPLKFAD